MNSQYIYLSPPNFSDDEVNECSKVVDSGWLAPTGPAIDQFEDQLEKLYNEKRVLALNSGTSALHLALILCGIQDGDEVIVSSFTFAACANTVLYERAVPVFLDSEESSWNLDPELLESYLKNTDKLPKAIMVTHLYGMPANIVRIVEIAEQYGIKVIEDAAESLGSTFQGKHLGGFGHYGILSFNGNKIITTTSGGALICDEDGWERAKFLSTQANSGTYEYDHKEAGYNYRMSNVLAGIGIAQLTKLNSFLLRKKFIFETYSKSLEPYFDFLPESGDSVSNRWLTTAVLKDTSRSIEDLIQYLNRHQIETRRLWKPLHLHDAYSESVFIGSGVCESLFQNGICLPSGTALSERQLEYVIGNVKEWFA